MIEKNSYLSCIGNRLFNGYGFIFLLLGSFLVIVCSPRAIAECGDSDLVGSWVTTTGNQITNRLVIKPDCTAVLRTWSYGDPRKIDGQYLEFDWAANSETNMWEVKHTYYLGCNFNTGTWERLNLSGGKQGYQKHSTAVVIGGVVYKKRSGEGIASPRAGDECTALYNRR